MKSSRRRAASLTAAMLALGIVAPSATAAISGTVTNSAGVPLGSAQVEVRDSAGAFVATDSTSGSTGAFFVGDTALTGHTAPYTVTTTFSDSCRASAERTRTTVNSGVTNASVLTVAMDVLPFCAPSFVPSTLPAGTGLADGATGQVVVPRGGRTYITATLPTAAQNVVLTTDDGRSVGGIATGTTDILQVIAPTTEYSGGLTLRYTIASATSSHRIGTLEVPSRQAAGPTSSFDLVNVIDISGSMASNDPSFRRKDAVGLVLDLSRTRDRVGAVGFDTSAETIFGLTSITGRSTINKLRKRANAGIVNRGGTDYDAGLAAAYAQLSGAPNRGRPKAAIFLTDGAHSGTYDNTHLRFAANGTGRTWPICVVRLGRSFASADVTRLKRIAKDTGGLYVAAPTNTKLTDLYFRCRGRTAGESTGKPANTTLRRGQSRAFSQVLPRGLGEVTFFASWDKGTVDMVIRRPGGPTYTAKRRPKTVTFRKGARYAFFRVKKPKAGKWLVGIRGRTNVGAVSLRASSRPQTAIVRRGGDILTPLPGDTEVRCGDVKATIVGSDGNDLIIGTPKRDVIQAGGGNDRVSGLGGNDLICLGAGELDRGSGGPGRDIIWGNQPHFSPATVDKNRGRFLPDGVNRINGGAGNDGLQGAAGNDVITGGPGRDGINGGPGDDTISGNGGNDALTSEDGADRLFGGPGHDRASGGAGDDQLFGQAGRDNLAGASGDDLVSGGAGNDFATGGVGADRVFGGSGNDVLRGDVPTNPPVGHGPDRIFGGAGKDRITGGAGDDVINGGQGKDDIKGDAGSDAIRTGDTFAEKEKRPVVRRQGDRADGGPGADTIVGGNGRDFLIGGPNNDRIFGGDGNDSIRGGNFRGESNLTDSDRLFGEAGRDTILGGGGPDRLDGGSGADVLSGAAGSDQINGGPGNDLIEGDRASYTQAGRDVMRGGTGNDRIFARYFDDVSLGGPGNDFIKVRGLPRGRPARGKHTLNGGPGRDRCSASKSLVKLRKSCELN